MTIESAPHRSVLSRLRGPRLLDRMYARGTRRRPLHLALSAAVAVASVVFLAANRPEAPMALAAPYASHAVHSIVVPDSVGLVGRFTSLRIDAAGYPAVSYYDDTNGDLKVLRCGDPDCTVVSAIAVPDVAGNVGQFTSLALDAAGNPVVAYYDFTNANLKVLHCGSPTCSAGNTLAAPDTGGDVGRHASLVLDPAGNPAVAYYDTTNANLKVLRCGNPSCTAGNTVASPDTIGDVGRHASIALDPAGSPVVAYYDATSANLKVLRCGNPSCTAGNTLAAPDTGGDVGRHASLVLNPAGNPVVAYYDATNGDLKVLHCGNPSCTAGNTVATPDSLNDVGRFSSLALDPAGNPTVAYYDATYGDVKLLHCTTPTCTAAFTRAVPDTLGDVGRYASLALDAGSYPVISYHNSGSGDLKVLRCGTSTCL